MYQQENQTFDTCGFDFDCQHIGTMEQATENQVHCIFCYHKMVEIYGDP